MRKIIASNHVSLDGFVAGTKGEMNWIKLDHEMFDFIGTLTDEADTALYGRVTYQMMNNYWPEAADKPGASKHDIRHSAWYNQVEKVVLSKTLKDKKVDKTTFIYDNILQEITVLKHKPGKNILIFGSPSAVHSLLEFNLIDEYWLFVNPVLLGNGIPMFGNIKDKIELKSSEVRKFPSGVVGLNYVTKRE